MDLEKLISETKASILKEDLRIILPIIKSINPKIILEIGMWHGHSFKLWYDAFSPELIIGIDLMKKPSDAVEVSSPNCHYLWESDSNGMATVNRVNEILNGRKIDFLFIDGDHHFDFVKQDWQFYSPLVRKGGIVFFHDVIYQSPNEEVYKFWPSVKLVYPYVELRGVNYSTGCGLVFV